MGSKEEVSFPSTKAENHSKQKALCCSPREDFTGHYGWGLEKPQPATKGLPHSHLQKGGGEQEAVPYGPSHIQQEGTGDEGGRYLPNDGQGSEELAGAAGPPQGFVWLAEADRPQGSAFWAAGPELGRASIKSNRVVCCGWEPCFETKRRGQVLTWLQLQQISTC